MKTVITFLFVLAFLPCLSFAQIYQWTDENGVKHWTNSAPPEEYTDQAKESGEVINTEASPETSTDTDSVTPRSPDIKPTDGDPSLPDVIESKIDGEFEGWEGDTVVRLMNGQIWQQSVFYNEYYYAYMPDVIIYRSGSGYKMKVDGIDKAVGVIQLH